MIQFNYYSEAFILIIGEIVLMSLRIWRYRNNVWMWMNDRVWIKYMYIFSWLSYTIMLDFNIDE